MSVGVAASGPPQAAHLQPQGGPRSPASTSPRSSSRRSSTRSSGTSSGWAAPMSPWTASRSALSSRPGLSQ
eukprot:14245388-Alexandrium_andersonii.AAC.1